MSEKDNGGAAFPIAGLHGMPFGGMSLRDWYAGMALLGILANTFIGILEQAGDVEFAVKVT